MLGTDGSQKDEGSTGRHEGDDLLRYRGNHPFCHEGERSATDSEAGRRALCRVNRMIPAKVKRKGRNSGKIPVTFRGNKE